MRVIFYTYEITHTMLKRTFCIVLLTLLSFSIQVTADVVCVDDALQFINKYKDIAVREMHRTGIPASVTLAQAIHESSWGKGTLALNSNNHFGIKCKADWAGKTYHKEDDDYVNGKLVKSCFRHYPSVDASYTDHSNFLMENVRYAPLFQLNPKDYISWAKGLKSCGYATDPKYATKLIRTIEDYQLYEYDFIEAEEPVLIANVPTQSTAPAIIPEQAPVVLQQEPYGEFAEVEVPAAYQIPENYVRNSHYKKSQPLRRPEITRTEQESVNESTTVQAFENEQYAISPQYSQGDNEVVDQEEEFYGEKAGTEEIKSRPSYPSTHQLAHTPMKSSGIHMEERQPKLARNSVIKNRRLPRVRITQSRK